MKGYTMSVSNGITFRPAGRPKGSTDENLSNEMAAFAAAVLKATEGKPAANINAAVKSLQASREKRGKLPYTDSSLLQTLRAKMPAHGVRVQFQADTATWVGAKR